MNQLFFLEVEPFVTPSVFDDMVAGISNERREKVFRYRLDIDKKISVLAETLIRCLICNKTGMSYEDIAFEVSPLGKPFLKNYPGLEFNISHTKNAVAAALSGAPVGVDIEKVRDIDVGIAKKVFSDNEKAFLNSEKEDQNRRFFDIWTKKEAYIKHDGRGLSNDLRNIDVTSSRLRQMISTVAVDDYIISLCSNTPFDRSLEKISEPELIEMWRKYAG